MAYRSILVHLTNDRRDDIRLNLAVQLAQAFEAELAGLFVVPPPVVPAPVSGLRVPLGPQLERAQREAAAEQSDRARRAFEQACGRLGRGGDWLVLEGDPQAVLALRARYFDLAVLAQSEVEGPASWATQLPERVVLSSGRPVFVVPYVGTFERIGERVLIAWDASREAARAVHDALPLLVRAGHVDVLQIDPPDERGEAAAELARRLGHHGIEAKAHHTVSGGIPSGEILLSMLADLGADCLVMGAYGHSRVRELALGGVTRSVLGHMTVPVLMAY